MVVAETPDILPDPPWQKTSLRQLLLMQLRLLKQWLALLIPQAFLSSTDSFGELGRDGLWLTSGLIFFMALLRFEQWRRLQFRISSGLEIRTGLFKRCQQQISAARLSEVQLEQSFSERVLGIYTLSLHQAGGTTLTLPGLGAATLKMLSITLPSDAKSDTGSVFWIFVRDATASGVLWVPMVMLSVTVAGVLSNERWQAWQNFAQMQDRIFLAVSGWSWWQWGLCSAGLLPIIGLMLALATYLWHYPRDYLHTEQRFTLRSGSVFRRTIALTVQRIQSVTWRQTYLESILQRWTLILTAATGREHEKTDARLFGLSKDALAAELRYYLPAAAVEVMQQPFALLSLACLKRRCRWMGIGTVIAIIFSLVLVWFTVEQGLDMWLWPGVFSLLVWGGVAILKSWNRMLTQGYLLTGDALYLRHGRRAQQFTWIPWSQVQHVLWLQSRHGQAHRYVTLVICNKAGRHELHGFPAESVAVVNAHVAKCASETISDPE